MPAINVTEAEFEALILKEGIDLVDFGLLSALPAFGLDDLIPKVSALDMDEIRKEIAADVTKK